jgi:hypothetical protein
MKKLTFALVLTFAVMLLSATTFAQEEGHYYTSTTWKISIPEDGSNAEFMELMQEWYDKVVSKNEKIISERVFRHQSGGDMRDWVFISEYASWNDIEEANNRQSELVNEGWPNVDERSAFFKKFWKYVDTHSDEIYQGVPELAK